MQMIQLLVFALAGLCSAADLSISDPVPGFASISGGTSGGGTDLSRAIRVNTMSKLRNAASGSGSAIILVEPGTYEGALSVGSNKSIIGVAPGVRIYGSLRVSGSSNVIIRNLAVQGKLCCSYDDCSSGDDAVYVGNGAHHVWLDHLDIHDGQDGNLDITKAGDFITVSWSKFHYTYNKEHRYSNLIAGSDDEVESKGKLRITYMLCHWGDRVESRQPRGRFGSVHMLNNYHKTNGGQIHGVGFDMSLIAEKSVYEEKSSIWSDMGSPRGWLGTNNLGNSDTSRGSVFTIPYKYSSLPNNEVVQAIRASDCGAGNTCTFNLDNGPGESPGPGPSPVPGPDPSQCPNGGGGGGGGDANSAGGIGFTCFSGTNTVEVQGKGVVLMGSLQIGDFVRAGKNRFSRVYSFVHMDFQKLAEYHQIYADGLKMPLEVSSRHLVFVNETMRPASHVKVGDMLGEHKVSKITNVKRRGIYAPITESGDIIVSGVLASSYAAVHSYTPINQHTEAHAFFAFRRLVCAFDFAICENETYSDGFPDWLSPVIQVAMNTERNPLCQICATVVGLPLVSFVYTLEQMIQYPLVVGAIILGLLCAFKKTKKPKNKDH